MVFPALRNGAVEAPELALRIVDHAELGCQAPMQSSGSGDFGVVGDDGGTVWRGAPPVASRELLRAWQLRWVTAHVGEFRMHSSSILALVHHFRALLRQWRRSRFH